MNEQTKVQLVTIASVTYVPEWYYNKQILAGNDEINRLRYDLLHITAERDELEAEVKRLQSENDTLNMLWP